MELTRVIAHQMIDQSCADTSSQRQEDDKSDSQSKTEDVEILKQKTAEDEKKFKEQQDATLAVAKAEKDKAGLKIVMILPRVRPASR